jgi:hypothetical protein
MSHWHLAYFISFKSQHILGREKKKREREKEARESDPEK